MITNINDGFDFLGFNIRKFGDEILTKPSKSAQKRFLAKVRTTVKSNKSCRQESLIRLLNPMITGWGNYYKHGATRDAFHWADHQIFNALWQWAKRRHSKKGKRWVADKYWHVAKGRDGVLRRTLINRTENRIVWHSRHCRTSGLSGIFKSREMRIRLIGNTIFISIRGKPGKCLIL